jgi:hypothetical protein
VLLPPRPICSIEKYIYISIGNLVDIYIIQKKTNSIQDIFVDSNTQSKVEIYIDIYNKPIKMNKANARIYIMYISWCDLKCGKSNYAGNTRRRRRGRTNR